MTILFPADGLPKGPKVDVQKALLLIDLQNDFVTPEGKLPVPSISAFLPNLPSLASKFRTKGSIIWVRTEFAQPRLTVSGETGLPTVLLKQHLEAGNTAGTYQPLQSIIQHDPEAFLDRSYPSNEARPCMPGTPGAQFPPALATTIDPISDLNLIKSDYSPFSDTNLLHQLRTRMITHLYVCGALSNVSVYATVLDAVRHGLQVTLIEDGLGHLDLNCHREAVRQMADNMGAAGIDYQELMDDLAGLLGDVIREEDFKSRFQVSLKPTSAPQTRSAVPPSQRQQRVEEWIASADSKRRQPTIESQRISPKPEERRSSVSNESVPRTKARSSRQGTPEITPPRKRSTSDLDETEEGFTPSVLPRSSSRREPPKAENTRRVQKSKPRLRNTRSSQESSTYPPSSLKSMQALQSKSTGDIPHKVNPTTLSDTSSEGPSLSSPKLQPSMLPQSKKQKKYKTSQVLGPTDIIGEGDCRLICDIVPPAKADGFFQTLKQDVQWQKMYHRSGEVPRLVAVQGHISENGDEIPIYRHPADESPPLLPFDATVDASRQIAETYVGHPLNHVLIQWYRSGEDNISEHSDKTLDIVRGSSIANLSFGAQRTMTLRTKKAMANTSNPIVAHTNTTITPQPEALSSDLHDPGVLTSITPAPPTSHVDVSSRKTQRIPLPHASLFLLGPSTNVHYLHSIRADKRPSSTKSPAELAFNCERISLTFRHVGTFINLSSRTIWGQGATSKIKEDAREILVGGEAEREGERMIRAFGVENHCSEGWEWEEWYGGGFDVVDFAGREVGQG